jgi:hypothetical protein
MSTAFLSYFLSTVLYIRRARFTLAIPFLLTSTFLAFCATWCYAQGSPATVSGQVTDPSTAVVRHGKVTLTEANGAARTAITDDYGRYHIDGLPTGTYVLQIENPGFSTFRSPAFKLGAGQGQHMDVRLEIQQATQKITVSGEAAQIGLDPAESAGNLVLRGSDLDALSDDPEDLANDLQMLAGPAPGADGPQIYIDGFTDGIMPPKQSIREARVNQNPFSAEFDRVGFGRIEILTKPGSGKYHGQASFDFGNRALTARNPYLLSPTVPDYQQEMIGGNFGGPLSKKSSFFVDVQRRITDENAVLNYTQLDTSLNTMAVSTAVVAPSRRFSISPRIDYALNPNNTLTFRYALAQTSAKNQGFNSQAFDTGSLGYGANTLDQNVQVSESAVLSSSALNESRFQFYRTHADQSGLNTTPEIDVQGAFATGGTFALNYTNRNRYEFQNYTTISRGTHTIRFGMRWRGDWLAQQSATNFNGRFLFSSNALGMSPLSVYAQNQLLSEEGVSQAQIAALGFGPSQFFLTTGRPLVSVNQFDVGPFVQDDWRIKPNLMISAGLRYETQNGIAFQNNFAPRAAISWAPGHTNTPKTVLRAGSGVFYDRFTSDLLWNAARQDGVAQTQYIVRNPNFFPTVPNPETLASLVSQQNGISTGAVYQIDPHLRVPYLIQTSAVVERSLPHNTSVSLSYTNSRGVHVLRTRDINAPLPTSYDAQGIANGRRPYGAAAGDIYQYEGSGFFRQNQVIFTTRATINKRISLFGYYVYSRAMSDTDGPGSFPSNPYDLRSEYGRAAYDARHRAFISGTFRLPLRIRLAPFLFLQSGLPYNVTSGVDTNGDGNPNDDRLAFAQDLSRASVVQKSGFPTFDLSPNSLPNAVLVPRNYLEGPGILSLTVRISRTWSFGESGKGGNTGGDEIRGGASIQNSGLGGSSSQSGMAGASGGTATRRPYNLTLTASIRNALNNVNPATPIGNLSSPYFGQSIALSTFGPLPGAGPNAGAGNRHIELQLRFTF